MKKVVKIQASKNSAKNRNKCTALDNRLSLLNNFSVIDLWEFGLIGKIKEAFDGAENSLKPKNIE